METGRRWVWNPGVRENNSGLEGRGDQGVLIKGMETGRRWVWNPGGMGGGRLILG